MIIKPCSGASFLLKKGNLLKVKSPEGKQVSDLFAVVSEDINEFLSTAHSMDYADSIYLTKGNQLYSNRSRSLLTIIDDDCGRHDLLMPPCSLKMFNLVSGNEKYHPSCHENLFKALSSYGLSNDQIRTAFNIFMNVEVNLKGQLKILPPLVNAGESITLRAEIDLFVALTACSHEETNDGVCKCIEYDIEDHE